LADRAKKLGRAPWELAGVNITTLRASRTPVGVFGPWPVFFDAALMKIVLQFLSNNDPDLSALIEAQGLPVGCYGSLGLGLSNSSPHY
jgi:hypothetical protein